MGPWSGQACHWLRSPRITSYRAHSIVLTPQNPVTPHALFMEVKSKEGSNLYPEGDPEVYPRPDGNVYICGQCDNFPLPVNPTQIKPTEKSIGILKQDGALVSSKLGEAKLSASQVCYLPNTSDGLPVIGKLPQVEGAYIASGHTFWGILNSPATGAAMAELIVDGKSTIVDLGPFDPARLC